MFAKPTGMARMRHSFTERKATVDELKLGGTEVTKPLVKPASSDDAGEGKRRAFGRRRHGVEVTSGVTVQDRRPTLEVLDRETKQVKFNRNRL